MLRVGEPHRATRSRVAEGASTAVGGEQRRREEAEAEGGLEHEALVWAAGLQLRCLGHLLGAEERLGESPFHRAGEAGVEARQRAGVGDTVGGRDLGGADGRVVEATLRLVEDERRCAQCLAEHGVGAHELGDQLGHGRVLGGRERPIAPLHQGRHPGLLLVG